MRRRKQQAAPEKISNKVKAGELYGNKKSRREIYHNNVRYLKSI